MGAALALLPWLHTRFAVLAAGFGLILLLRLWPRPGWPRLAAALLAVPVASAATWFGFFWAVWGTPNPAAPYGQATQSAWAHLRPAVPGLLFDQQVGLVPNAPVYAAAFIGMLSLGRRHRRLAVEIAVVFTGYLLAVGAYRMWWGGYSAPGRFLVAVRYGRIRVFSFDDDTFMEPGGFWTRGGATAEVLVADGGADTGAAA